MGIFKHPSLFSGWGYYQPNGKIGNGGPAVQEYGDPFINGIVEVRNLLIAFANSREHYPLILRHILHLQVELDCDAQTISFYLNGKFQVCN